MYGVTNAVLFSKPFRKNLVRFVQEKGPTLGDLSWIAVILGTAAIALGSWAAIDYLSGTHTISTFKEFCSQNWQHALVLTGGAIATILIAKRIIGHHLIEQQGGAKDLAITMIAMTALALGTLYYTDHVFNTHLMDKFSDFWKTGGIHVAEMTLAAAVAGVIILSMFKKKADNGDKAIVALIIAVAFLAIGGGYAYDAIRHTQTMKPFSDFFSNEWKPILEVAGTVSGFIGLLGITALIEKEKTLTRLAYLVTLTALTAFMIGWASYNGINPGNETATFLHGHVVAAIVGTTLGTGIALPLMLKLIQEKRKRDGEVEEEDEERFLALGQEPVIIEVPVEEAPPITLEHGDDMIERRDRLIRESVSHGSTPLPENPFGSVLANAVVGVADSSSSSLMPSPRAVQSGAGAAAFGHFDQEGPIGPGHGPASATATATAAPAAPRAQGLTGLGLRRRGTHQGPDSASDLGAGAGDALAV